MCLTELSNCVGRIETYPPGTSLSVLSFWNTQGQSDSSKGVAMASVISESRSPGGCFTVNLGQRKPGWKYRAAKEGKFIYIYNNLSTG